VHLRRKDFATYMPLSYCNNTVFAKTLCSLGKAFGARAAFLATDATPGELEDIRQKVKAHREEKAADGADSTDCPIERVLTYSHEQDSAAWEAEAGGAGTSAQRVDAHLHGAQVEQAIASGGQFFVGTSGSHFSLEIHFERLARGTSWEGADGSLVGDGSILRMCGEGVCTQHEPWKARW
jgi:hypothetical protein